MNIDYKKVLTKVLLRKAKGYTYKEKTEEFNIVDGDAVLNKKKIVTKHTHPDVAAVKALLQISEEQLDVCQLTDEQLQVEKLRLLQLLRACEGAEASQQPVEE